MCTIIREQVDLRNLEIRREIKAKLSKRSHAVRTTEKRVILGRS